MKTKKLFFLFSILLSMLATNALAYDIEAKNADGVTLYYDFIRDNTELEVSAKYDYGYHHKYSGSVVIPEDVTYNNKTYKVTRIGRFAFSGSSDMTSVTLPNSVYHIAMGAFGNCSSLTSITLQNNVEYIEQEAFYGCSSLISINIPEKVRGIGNSAFEGCNSLKSITIPNSTLFIGYNIFSGCSNLESVTIGESVISIEKKAFEGCSSLTSVDIPNSVTSIDKFAFSNCGLVSITIPNSVTSIRETAFYGCGQLKSITIPNSVTSIEAFTFANCTTMETVTIPNSVISIGDNAFRFCACITSATIPNSVEFIGKEAFKQCYQLETVTIPNSVKSIGKSAFEECQQLRKITSKIVNPFAIDDKTFDEYTYSTATLYVPKGTVEAYKATEGWKNFKNIVEEGTSTGIADAEATTNLIDAIGTVEYTESSKAKIAAARAAYDALTKEQQALVKNLSVLIAAEEAYDKLAIEATGISNITADNVLNDGKYVVDGKIILVKNGRKYNLNGVTK